jgi:hypothetical protein
MAKDRMQNAKMLSPDVERGVAMFILNSMSDRLVHSMEHAYIIQFDTRDLSVTGPKKIRVERSLVDSLSPYAKRMWENLSPGQSFICISFKNERYTRWQTIGLSVGYPAAVAEMRVGASRYLIHPIKNTRTKKTTCVVVRCDRGDGGHEEGIPVYSRQTLPLEVQALAAMSEAQFKD